GPVSVLFTAWWIYVIRAVTFGGRAIPLVTLASVLVLAFAVGEWIRASFPSGPARAIALVLMCATPLVGALGIQVRHDVPMTAGLLLFAAVMTRTSARGGPLTRADYAALIAAALLVATRYNGLPTVLGAAACAGLFAPPADKRRWAAIGVPLALGVFVVPMAATRASGNARTIDPLQSVEWALGDISCVLSKPGVQVSAA